MKILITGSEGFIGRNLQGHFRALGIDFLRFDYSNHAQDTVLNGAPFEDKAREYNPNAIVHLAARTSVPDSISNPWKYLNDNSLGCLNVLEAARAAEVSRVVIASSGAAKSSESPYGASKAGCERMAKAYWASYGVEAVSLRFSNVYGPYSQDKQSVVAKFIKAMMKGEDLNVYGDGSQMRDFVHVVDVCRAILLACKAPAMDVGGRVFEIGTGVPTSIKSLVELLQEVSGNGFQVNYRKARHGDVSVAQANVQSARDVLGFVARADLREGIEHTYNYFKGGG